MQGSWWLVGLVGMAGAGLAQGEDRTRDAGVALDAVCARPIWGRPLPQVVGISDDALGATRTAVQAFNRDVETYLDCLEQAEQKIVSQGSTSGLDLAAVQEAMIDRNDAAVDEITRVAEAFNEGLRARKLAEAEPARPAVNVQAPLVQRPPNLADDVAKALDHTHLLGGVDGDHRVSGADQAGKVVESGMAAGRGTRAPTLSGIAGLSKTALALNGGATHHACAAGAN